MEQQSGETTALLTDQPSYVFESGLYRVRKIRARRFQFCFCSILVCVAVVAVVAGVSYSLREEPDGKSNATDVEDSFLLLASNSWPLQDAKSRRVLETDENKWKYALGRGESALRDRIRVEMTSPALDVEDPAYRHQKVFVATNFSDSLARLGFSQVYATKQIYKYGGGERLCNPAGDFGLDFCESRRGNGCEGRFRTYDGSCNNVAKPNSYGVAFTPFRRALAADYADGVSKPRTSADKKGLPSARKVSRVVHRPVYKNDVNFTVMLAVWGQFIDHDVTATAPNRGRNGQTISCCQVPEPYQHPECFPVYLDQDDPFQAYNTTCMDFVRSAAAPTCCLGPRQQINQVSSFLDGSMIYGPNGEIAGAVRSFTGGALKMHLTPDDRSLLPFSEDPNDGCNRREEMKKGRYCFMTGDSRANENLLLTSMHLIWARQHNTVARGLSQVNPHWDDERVFQESRRILGAQIQHITYDEFLPIILGADLAEKFELTPKKGGFYERYDPDVDPSVANSFAAAAFRFAHTLIPGLMKRLANDTQSVEFVEMHKMLFDPFLLFQPSGLDGTLVGAMETNVEASDPFFAEELKRRLFERKADAAVGNGTTGKCGLDLVSLNIQRGRDHGLPGYGEWRGHCGLKRPRGFDELAGVMADESLDNIRAVYRTVDDVDLYTGGLSEKPLPGGILGPTMTCLILDQFVRLKRGDRYWYENGMAPHAFTERQLDEIRKTTLAGVICDNSDGVARVQPYVMRTARGGNRRLSCVGIQRPQLTAWKDADLPRIPISDKAIFVNYVNASD